VSEENHEIPETTPEPAPKKRPSWFRRTGYTLFSPETRTGRIMRPVLIYFGMLVVGFALGALVVYLWMYQPVVAQWTTARSALQNTQGELEQTQIDLEQNRQELNDSQSEVQTLQDANEILEQRLATAETRIRLLRVMYQAKTAQSALQNREPTPARRALQEARTELDAAMPSIGSEGDEVAQSLTLRLDLAINGLTRDPTTARADLEILINNLILLERLLAQR
jgi:DNA repair exonuclease SbcCD ATPase subunit